MTITARPLGLVVAAALTLSGATLAGVGPADAAGRSYGTVLTLDSAKLQACKVEIQRGTKYRVYGFLDNRRSRPSDKVFGRITVQKDGKNTSQSFDTGYIRGGQESKVESVVIPRKKGFRLEVVAAGTNAGNGGTIATKKVRNC
ncbi:hypothetical protein BH11ACT8_BH11ACT8_15080 [soil metagenome]